jgi:hypothetical protein
VRRPKVTSSEIDDAIEALLDPDGAAAATDGDMDEYERWKAREPKANKDSYAAVDPVSYWIGLRGHYPNLSRMAIDVLSSLYLLQAASASACLASLATSLNPGGGRSHLSY